MEEDKVKSIEILKRKLNQLQNSLKKLKQENECLSSQMKTNKRYSKCENLKADLRTQDFILSIFKQEINNKETYTSLINKILKRFKSENIEVTREDLKIELDEKRCEAKKLKEKLNEVLGLNKSRKEVGCDNLSLNFLKPKEPPSLVYIEEKENVDISNGVIKGVLDKLKDHRNLLNRECETVQIKFNQNSDKINKARSVLYNIEEVKKKLKRTEDELISMDDKNNHFKQMLESYKSNITTNTDGLEKKKKELLILKENIKKENLDLQDKLQIEKDNIDDEEISLIKQDLLIQLKNKKISLMDIKIKTENVQNYESYLSTDLIKKKEKLKRLFDNKNELIKIYKKKEIDLKDKQYESIKQLKSERNKAITLLKKLKELKNEEFTFMGRLEGIKESYNTKKKIFTALRLLKKREEEKDYYINASEELNDLILFKSKLEEELIKKELYLKHRRDLSEISSFHSSKDVSLLK